MVAKGASFGIGSTGQGRHSSGGGPCIKYKFDENDKSGRLDFVMRKVNSGSTALNNMSYRNLKLEKRRLPTGETVADGLKQLALLKWFFGLRKIFKNLLLSTNGFGLR